MSDDFIKKHLNNLTENVEEIMTSTRAVKGPGFAILVAICFESMQIMESMAKIAACAKEEYRDYAQSMLASSVNVMSGIMFKLFEGYTDAEIEEAGSIAKMLLDRRSDAVAAIKKGMEDEQSD